MIQINTLNAEHKICIHWMLTALIFIMVILLKFRLGEKRKKNGHNSGVSTFLILGIMVKILEEK